jgi:hypothetical protein
MEHDVTEAEVAQLGAVRNFPNKLCLVANYGSLCLLPKNHEGPRHIGHFDHGDPDSHFFAWSE